MLNSNSINAKVLARNTIYLYVRTLFSMFVNLFTSRVILQYLGVEDYGIYNAVAGIVAMFGIISGSLSNSISRNITFELGKNNMERLNKFFSVGINIQVIIILIIVFLGETIGLWFLNARMVIPEMRLVAANWIFQFSLAIFALNLMSVPYSASLIAHEKMSLIAYISILEAILKLAIVYMVALSPIDRLITYVFLLFCISALIQFIYIIYCKRNFAECSYHFTSDKDIYHKMFGFAIWNFIGSASSLFRSQGVNIILNLFFGPVVNAARAISMQVNGGVNSFVTSFMTALTPQITKSYAQGNFYYLINCIYRGSKFSYFLLYMLSLPFFVETDFILKAWLVDVPDTTAEFVRYILVFSLVDTYSRSLIHANNATGDIKVYQIVVGSLNLLVLPIAYAALYLGASAESVVLVSIFISIIGIFPRIYFCKKHIPISYIEFIVRVILPTVIVSIISFTIPYFIKKLLPDTFLSFIILILICFVSTLISIVFLGCTKEERNMGILFIRKKLNIK